MDVVDYYLSIRQPILNRQTSSHKMKSKGFVLTSETNDYFIWETRLLIENDPYRVVIRTKRNDENLMIELPIPYFVGKQIRKEIKDRIAYADLKVWHSNHYKNRKQMIDDGVPPLLFEQLTTILDRSLIDDEF